MKRLILALSIALAGCQLPPPESVPTALERIEAEIDRAERVAFTLRQAILLAEASGLLPAERAVGLRRGLDLADELIGRARLALELGEIVLAEAALAQARASMAEAEAHDEFICDDDPDSREGCDADAPRAGERG